MSSVRGFGSWTVCESNDRRHMLLVDPGTESNHFWRASRKGGGFSRSIGQAVEGVGQFHVPTLRQRVKASSSKEQLTGKVIPDCDTSDEASSSTLAAFYLVAVYCTKASPSLAGIF